MTAAPGALMRPDDADAYRHALRLSRRRTGVPLVFGGQLSQRRLVLEEFLGDRTEHLHGLNVLPGKGIGGFVVTHLHPFAVNDYASAQSITHDYDDPVLGEGIRSIVAAPVTVHGTVRGVLYAAARSVFPLGDKAIGGLASAARELATEIAIRDEVDRRIRLLETAVPRRPSANDLRDLHDELCDIAADIDDAALRARLRHACDRFAVVGVGERVERPASASPSPLSPRELDVLEQVALGCANAEVADRLALRPETVKAYLRSATRKLGVHGRYQAVLAARRRGILR